MYLWVHKYMCGVFFSQVDLSLVHNDINYQCVKCLEKISSHQELYMFWLHYQNDCDTLCFKYVFSLLDFSCLGNVQTLF